MRAQTTMKSNQLRTSFSRFDLTLAPDIASKKAARRQRIENLGSRTASLKKGLSVAVFTEAVKIHPCKSELQHPSVGKWAHAMSGPSKLKRKTNQTRGLFAKRTTVAMVRH